MASLTSEQKRRIEENRQKALALRAAKASQGKSGNCLGAAKLGSAWFKSIPGGSTGGPSGPGSSSKSELQSTSSSKVVQVPAVAHSSFVSHNGAPGNQEHTKSTGLSNKCDNKPNFYSGSRPAKDLGVGSFSSSQSSGAKPTFSCSGAPNSNYKDKFHNVPKSSSSDGKAIWLSASPSEKTQHEQSQNKGPAIKGCCILVSRCRFEVQVGYNAPAIEIFKSMTTKQYDPRTRRWTFELKEYNSLLRKLDRIKKQVEIEPLPRPVTITFRGSIQGEEVRTRHIPDYDLSCVEEPLVKTLMPFQRDGVNFALSEQGRLLIADDMGLGKTIQAICIACFYRREWPLLIVTPSSVRFQWKEHFRKWVSSLDEDEIHVASSSRESVTRGLINILSYDLMAKNSKELLRRGYKVVIMDESHFLKNSKTARTQGAMPLLKAAQRVILLSGTPALSRPNELFSQISAVSPKTFPNFFEFGKRYCAGKQMPWGWDFSGSSNMEELQLVLQEHIMIRRLKKDVMKQLPAKRRQMVLLDPASVKIDKRMKSSVRMIDQSKGTERHGALLEYFHETCSAKTVATREYILDQLEAEHKFLMFAHHQEMLDAIEEAVKKKWRYIRIDGRTTAEQRNFFCEKFQNNDDVRIAILSITAANAGLNLTSAALVIFAELFWNPGILVQAEDRAHRIGQEDSVNIHYLVAQGTADDFIWPLVQQKLDVLSKAGLTKSDLLEHDTKMQDTKDGDIMKYFEKSFLEEDCEAGLNHANTVHYLGILKWTDRYMKGAEGSRSITEFFKPAPSTSNFKENNTAQDNMESNIPIGQNKETETKDWLDTLDELWDDIDPDEPWPKKPRTEKNWPNC